jgi:uncharacterized RDD family membrane protein YckC
MAAGNVLVFTILLSAAFALVYLPVVTRLSRGSVSPYVKADIRRRLGAATVDGLLLTTCLIFYRSLDSPLFLVAGSIYVLLRDALFVRGQSVGKFIFSLLVVSLETGRPCSRAESVRRNLLFLVPGLNIVAAILETITVIRDPQGQRLGDRLARTQVVEGLGARELIRLLQKELLEIRVAREPLEEPIEVERCSHESHRFRLPRARSGPARRGGTCSAHGKSPLRAH